MDMFYSFTISILLVLIFTSFSKEIPQGLTKSQTVYTTSTPHLWVTTASEPAAPAVKASSNGIDAGKSILSQTDIHDLYPAVSDHHYILLDYEGVIAMIDCTKSDRHAEITQCDWIIHVENGSVLEADIYVDIPQQPEEYDCAQCRIQYGYIIHHKERVEVKRTCQHNIKFQYTVKSSMWLRFFCLGQGAHHKLDWMLDGRELQGFNLSYSISELSTPPKQQQGWDLSTIFALTVMMLSVLAVGSIGFIIYRNCRSQSLQKNILQSRHHNRSGGSKLGRLTKQRGSVHRHGPHEQFFKQHVAHKKLTRVTINEPLPSHTNSMISTEYEEMSDETGQVALSALPSATDRRPAVVPRRFHIRPTKSNHTYVSIIQQQRNSDSNSDRERVDDAGVHRYPSRPVKSVSEHFLYADNSVTPSPETEPDEIPLRQPPRRHKPTQQCVMFRSKSHHSGMEPPKRKKKKRPLPCSKHAGVASEYEAAVNEQGLQSNPSGLSLPCGIIDELHGDSSGTSAASKHRQRTGLYLKKDEQKSQSATSLNSEMSVVLKVIDPCDDSALLQPGVLITEAEYAGEPQIDEARQTKLLTAPRYNSPKSAPIPHIILTRASTKRKHHNTPGRGVVDCSPVEEVDSSHSNQDVTSGDERSSQSMSCSEPSSLHERSRSTNSLPDDFSRTEARLQQHINYASDDSAVVPSSRHRTVDAIRDNSGHLRPRNLTDRFTPDAVLQNQNRLDEPDPAYTPVIKEYGSTDSGVQSRTADLNHDST